MSEALDVLGGLRLEDGRAWGEAAHPFQVADAEAVLAELGAVRLRETSPGVVRLDHSGEGHDDQAVALAMAAVCLLDRPASSSAPAASFGGHPHRLDEDVGAVLGGPIRLGMKL